MRVGPIRRVHRRLGRTRSPGTPIQGLGKCSSGMDQRAGVAFGLHASVSIGDGARSVISRPSAAAPPVQPSVSAQKALNQIGRPPSRYFMHLFLLRRLLALLNFAALARQARTHLPPGPLLHHAIAIPPPTPPPRLLNAA